MEVGSDQRRAVKKLPDGKPDTNNMANRQYQDYTSHLARKRKATENRVVEELVTWKKRAEPPVTVDISDDYDEENDSSDTDEFSTVYGDEASKDKDEQEELATADKHSKK